MRASIVVLASLAVSTVASLARAEQEPPRSWREGPRGPGTEIGVTRPTDTYRVYEGTEIGGYIGGGYGLGLGGRVGYAFYSGLYAGGAFTFYTGNASFAGGELGYKFFPGYHWEVRPYMFAGPGFIRAGTDGFGRAFAETVFAVQPGVLGAYRFGPAFVSAELRAYLTPNPGALALFGGAGVSL
jgi:hypothetical protein